MNMQYAVNELFQTIQGEGHFTGQPSIFVRLQGCPVGCPWCDTKHTWEKQATNQVGINEVLTKREPSEHWALVSVDEMLLLIKRQQWLAKHVVITGGEPCLYDLEPLTMALNAQGFSCQIETSGTFEIKASKPTWVTLSAKVDMPGGYAVLPSALNRADEIKHPVARPEHVAQLKNLLSKRIEAKPLPIYLQPISQQQRATELAITHCIENNWRLSIQTHKYIGIE